MLPSNQKEQSIQMSGRAKKHTPNRSKPLTNQKNPGNKGRSQRQTSQKTHVDRPKPANQANLSPIEGKTEGDNDEQKGGSPSGKQAA